MEKDFRKKVSTMLEDLSLILGSEAGCLWVWGETKLPECVRREIEDEKCKMQNGIKNRR